MCMHVLLILNQIFEESDKDTVLQLEVKVGQIPESMREKMRRA